MKITLTIRNAGGGCVRVSTNFKRESLDTPRIGNLGLEIKAELDKMCDRCAKVKAVKT